MKEFVEEIVRIAEEAGALLLTHFEQEHDFIFKDSESISNDFATEADVAAEKFILAQLKTLRPNDYYVAEESGTADNGRFATDEEALIWHVDPLDGTVNFSRGLGYWCVSIAAVNAVSYKTELGVVHAPTMKKTFFSYGHRSYVKDETGVKVLKTPDHSTAHLLCFGLAYELEERTLLVNQIPSLVESFGDLRHLGACALNLCTLAEGGVDAYIELSAKTWDFMAGRLIAENAGVKVGISQNPRTKQYSVKAAKTDEDYSVLTAAIAKLNK